MRFCENNNISSAVVPVDLGGGANDGDWVSLENYHHVSVVLFKAIGTAGDDPTLTMEQATTNTGTGAKALTFRNIYVKQGLLLTAVGIFTRVDQAAAATYTDATSAELQAIWVVEFDSDELDVDGGFKFIRARVADVGGVQLGCILYILSEARFAQAVVPSAL